MPLAASAVGLYQAAKSSLTAVRSPQPGGNNAAGIGGGMQGNGGSVTINGGEVTATGGNQAAGIGSGTMGGRIQIQINGGTVNATGGSQGAGIGDGMECSNDGSITITGGTVTATGGYQGTGIGGGAKTPGGKITISGGTVTANGADGASGIGHGGLGATGGEITISGGTVTATGGSGNPGISCQDAPENDSPIGEAGWILISGGTVYASPKAGEENGSAIRGSFKTGIDGDAFVVANGTGITDETNQDAWSGVIFDGDGDGKVYGNPTLETDAKIPAGKKLTIPQGSSLTISRGKKLELTDSTLTVESGAMLTNNGTISGNSNSKVESNGSLGGSGTVEGDITVPDPKDSAVSISPSSAAYGSEVTLTAQISQAPAANARADQGKVDFYLGTQDSGTKLGTADVINNTAELTITLSEEKGFKIGENTITADFGGSMVLGSKIVSAQLTVTGNLNDAVVTVSGNHIYTGSPITPAVSVTWNNTPLTKDTDYTLAYTDNTNAGTATVTVTRYRQLYRHKNGNLYHRKGNAYTDHADWPDRHLRPDAGECETARRMGLGLSQYFCWRCGREGVLCYLHQGQQRQLQRGKRKPYSEGKPRPLQDHPYRAGGQPHPDHPGQGCGRTRQYWYNGYLRIQQHE